MSIETTSNIFLLLFGGLQAILLSTVILQRSPHRASKYLAAFIVLVLCQISHKVVAKIWLSTHMFGVYKLGYELPFLYGPFIYLYILSLIKLNKRLPRKTYLHFLPFGIIGSIRLLFLYVFPGNYFLMSLLPYTGMRMSIHVAIKLLFLWAYFYASWILIRDFGKLERVKKWARKFVIIATGIESVIIVALGLMVQFYGRYPDVRWVFLLLTFLVYWLSYEYLVLDRQVTKEQNESKNKYSNSGLTDAKSENIKKELLLLMKEKRLYENPNVSLDILAQKLDISKHHLSQVINTGFAQNFHDFINSYRIKAAQEALKNPKNNHLTIAAIAFDSGFQSISNFNAHFKKHTQMTPSFFRKKTRQNIS